MYIMYFSARLDTETYACKFENQIEFTTETNQMSTNLRTFYP